jgi:hypothetical protein
MSAREVAYETLRFVMARVMFLGTPHSSRQGQEVAVALATATNLEMDIQARKALGWYHWYRALAVPDADRDLDVAVALFALVYQVEPETVPEALHPLYLPEDDPAHARTVDSAVLTELRAGLGVGTAPPDPRFLEELGRDELLARGPRRTRAVSREYGAPTPVPRHWRRRGTTRGCRLLQAAVDATPVGDPELPQRLDPARCRVRPTVRTQRRARPRRARRRSMSAGPEASAGGAPCEARLPDQPRLGAEPPVRRGW